MTKFDFDSVIKRRGTNSFKWDGTDIFYNSKDCLAMWCADMDFMCPRPITQALIERASVPIYGYTLRSKEFENSVLKWLSKRHGCRIPGEWLAFSPPGVIYAIYTMLRCITQEGDGVMIHMPNYDPLFDMIVKSNRKLIKSPLRLENNKFKIDFMQMEAAIKKEHPKALILSSPHNPTGRVWTEYELRKIADLCLNHNMYMLVDEIHADFISKAKNHTAFANLGKKVAEQSMICYSANKSFNLGGLQMSSLVIANEEKRNMFNEEMLIAQTRLDTPFGLTATQTAYTNPECEVWLDEAIAYVEDNKRYVEKFLENHIPEIRVIPSDGTYLIWLDCHSLKMKGRDLEHFMVEKAKVAFCGSYEFGEEGSYFVRMTAAVPRTLIKQALSQVKNAIRENF